jgi:opacity protein-like surface antigen
LILATALFLFPDSDYKSPQTKKNGDNVNDNIKIRKKSNQPRLIYFSIGMGFQWKSDENYQLVYNNGSLNYFIDAGYWFGKNFAFGIKFNVLSQNGETSVLKEETKLRQTYLMGYVKAGIGFKIRGYISLGGGFLFFKEESYMATVDENHFGFDVEIGTEVSLTDTLYLLGTVRYLSFKKSFFDLGETQQLGGTELRFGIGYRF